jgi:hypothetical protein
MNRDEALVTLVLSLGVNLTLFLHLAGHTSIAPFGLLFAAVLVLCFNAWLEGWRKR